MWADHDRADDKTASAGAVAACPRADDEPPYLLPSLEADKILMGYEIAVKGRAHGNEIIKDFSGRTLGFIRMTPTGRQEAYNTERQNRGYFDDRNHLTKDRGGVSVAKGNALAGLVFKNGKWPS